VAVIAVTNVRASWVPRAAQRSGLLAYVSCVVAGELRLDGLTVRVTRDGRRIVSFPSKKDRRGVERAFVAPLGEVARRSIQRQILDALDQDERVRP
jgi:DNA-binding cell septation regulator SpoVG